MTNLLQMRFYQKLLMGVVVMVGFGIVSLVHAQKAAAIQGSSIISTGRFSGGSQVGASIPSSVSSTSAFETYINYMLNGRGAYGIPASTYNEYGAAFIVETMLHGTKASGTTYTEGFSGYANLGTARSEYNTWKTIVNQYSAAGLIRWAVPGTICAGTLNTKHLSTGSPYGYSWDATVYLNASPANGVTGDKDGKKFQFYTMTSCEGSTFIEFLNPNGTVAMRIRRECANIVGNGKLTSLGWRLTGTTTRSAASVYVGQRVTFNNYIRNSGPATAATNWAVRYCWDACGGGYNSGYGTHAQALDGSLPVSGSPGRLENSWPYDVPDNLTHTRICVWIAYTAATGPGTAGSHSTMQCVTINKPIADCFVNAPSNAVAGQSFTVTAGATYQDATAAADVWNNSGRAFYAVGSASATGGSVSGNKISGTWTVPGQSPGTYTLTGGVKGSTIPTGNKSCSTTITVAYTPFFSVLGGTISAGPGFGTGCTDGGDTAGITATNNDKTGSGPFFGAGSQQAALALGKITAFASSMNSDGSDAGSGPPDGLTLANDGSVQNLANLEYGGSLGLNGWCVPDYASAAAVKATDESDANVDVSTLPSGVYKYNNLVHISASQPIPAGRNIVIVVDGSDARVESDIKYASYNTLANIPQFQLLITGGDILIQHEVSELHGVYDAQPDSGSGGTIYTCANGGAIVDGASAYSTCNTQLTFYGAVSADKLVLGRTWGNLAAVGGVPADPAEKFVFTPELWLAGWQPPTSGSGALPYQAITSLPPIL